MADPGMEEARFLLSPESDSQTKNGSQQWLRAPRDLRTLFMWFLCLSNLVLSAIVIYQWRVEAAMAINRSASWTLSDFDAIKTDIPPSSEQKRFTTGLKYNSTQQLYRTSHVGEPSYVGEPSKDIDDAWSSLVGAIDVFVTPEERAQFTTDMYFDPETKLYMGVLTVFHDLHCLNMLRKNLAIYAPVNDRNSSKSLQTHMEHCIDSLRLSIMCTGDMTLSPTMWSHEKGRIIPDFEVEHTCRDYGALKDWADARDSANPEKYPHNAKRLREAMRGGTRS